VEEGGRGRVCLTLGDGGKQSGGSFPKQANLKSRREKEGEGR
jgi:hypothetical protein